ncbi:hypothetical protein [Olleya sp. R77988]|uniref:hypothetical protein n=1 Tax=Olleya sp. R77988 TaxID=3093875 RepID=UPI0037C9FD1A
MSEIEIQAKNKTKDIKLHSAKAISGATFLGEPLAAGYLISENFNALNKPDEGRKSLIIGIITTIVLFGGIFLIPQNIIEKLPRVLIPSIYTAIIWAIVEWKQGDDLKIHKENENSFFSGWRAAGVGFISLLIIGIGLFGYAYLESNNPAYKIYDTKIEQFSKNETESLTFYDNISTKNNTTLISELDNLVIPKWKQNVDIIKELNTVDGLSSDLLNQNKTLLKYSELRLETFLLIKKAISEDTDKYDKQIEMLNFRIDSEIDKLNQN